MKYKDLTLKDKEDFIEIYFTKEKYTKKLMKRFNIGERTVYDWKNKIFNEAESNDYLNNFIDELQSKDIEGLEGLEGDDEAKDISIVSDEAKTIHKQKEEIKVLKKALNEAKHHVHESDEIKQFIYELNDNLDPSVHKDTSWLEKTKDTTKDTLMPVLIATDIHWGEGVLKSEIGVNEYNLEIARKRYDQIVDDFIDICTNKLSNYNYPGVVFPMVGDNTNGVLHLDAETNDETHVQQVATFVDYTIRQIDKLKEVFNYIFVPFNTGNHSRSSKYTKTSGRLYDSLEYLVAYFLEKHYANDDKVIIEYNEEDELRYNIFGTKFLQFHGDAIKGGGGVGGHIVPIKRYLYKKRQNDSASGRGFDVAILGHWHTHHVEKSLIIGASLVGPNGYSKMLSLPYEEPGMTMFFVSTKGDIIYSTHLKAKAGSYFNNGNDKPLEIFKD